MLLLMSNSTGRKKAPSPLFRSMLEPQAPASTEVNAGRGIARKAVPSAPRARARELSYGLYTFRGGPKHRHVPFPCMFS